MLRLLGQTVKTLSQVSTMLVHRQNLHFLFPNVQNLVKKPLLEALTPSLVPSCGFKVRGVVKRRCKDCFMVWREGRLYNICKTHPRHKQMSIVKKEKNTWILTHATQSKVRPY